MLNNEFSISVDEFIDLVQEHTGVVRDVVKNAIKSAGRRDRGTVLTQNDLENLKVYDDLFNRWYSSLPENPDYQVYDEPYYIIDLWMCWHIYSRNHIKNINKKKDGISVAESFGQVKKIVDLGCGLGFTTSLLKQRWPEAEVFGTNLASSFQYSVGQNLGSKYGFTMEENLSKIGGDVDLIFASEYFEHFYEPIEHLEEVLSILKPKHLLLANAFTADAIGHFNQYSWNGVVYPDRQISKLFNQFLRNKGYKKMKTGLWNDRPALWSKIDDTFENLFSGN